MTAAAYFRNSGQSSSCFHECGVSFSTLYSARHRAAFVKLAATELMAEERIVKKNLGRLSLKGARGGADEDRGGRAEGWMGV
ncbi:MAG: hypothetical protein ACRBN8_30870 [Nannocystales bacterium]